MGSGRGGWETPLQEWRKATVQTAVSVCQQSAFLRSPSDSMQMPKRQAVTVGNRAGVCDTFRGEHSLCCCWRGFVGWEVFHLSVKLFVLFHTSHSTPSSSIQLSLVYVLKMCSCIIWTEFLLPCESQPLTIITNLLYVFVGLIIT